MKDELPRIYTARILNLSAGETLPIGEGIEIECLDAWRHTYRFWDETEYFNESVDMAYSEDEGLWYNARWDARRHQWICSDLKREYDALYAVARTLKGLWGTRTYKTPRQLIVSIMSRQYA